MCGVTDAHVPTQVKLSQDKDEEDFPWHAGIFDAHCHPTDTMGTISSISSMKARCLVIMATRAQDQDLVAQVSERHGHTLHRPLKQVWDDIESQKHKVIPCFGWHPWFSYQLFDDQTSGNISALDGNAKVAHYQSVLQPKCDDHAFLLSLPDPQPLSLFIGSTRERLLDFPCALVGEVGLDKSFRLPEPWTSEKREQRDASLTPGGREGRRLTPYRIDIKHQKRVLLAQLRLAGELNRPVSCHSVATHGIIFETLKETWKGHEREVMSTTQRKRKADAPGALDDSSTISKSSNLEDSKPYPSRVCLHSFSGPPETVKQYFNPEIPCEFFFSFSTAVNFSKGSSSKVEAAILRIPNDRILIESDLHIAGSQMDEQLVAMVKIISNVKGWSLEHAVQQLRMNWERFVFGINT